MRRAPAFWANPAGAPGWQARALAPAAWVWGLGAAWRARHPGTRVGVPVICVGNLTVGGGGKTPMVGALIRRLAGWGWAPHVVSRGHGGTLSGPHRVTEADSAAMVGDEAILHAALAPTWVARDRLAGAQAAVAAGAEVILLDDGFQNPSLVKDLSLVMVDAALGFGNGRLLPAGPLREPVARGLARADLVVLVGDDAACAAARTRWPQLAPALTARIAPLPTGLDLAGQPVLAFAGIARPGKFFATLRTLGADLVGAEPFADHAPYGAAVLARLRARARAAGAMLVTTEKDAARLPPDFLAEVVVLPIALTPTTWAPIDQALARLWITPRESPRGYRP